MTPISTATGRGDERAGRGDGHQAGQHAVAIMPGSGLPNFHIMKIIAASAPPAEASMVFVATTPMRRSVPARVEPGLKPNQPKARMKVPTMAIGMLWPGIATGLPSLSNLPSRGPSTIAPASAATPPTMCTTDEPAKSTWPWPRPKLAPSCDEPAAAPDPVAEDRVDEHRHEEAVDEERRPLPALGHGPGRDGHRRVHEDHLEEEQREDADVVDVGAQEEARRCRRGRTACRTG